MTVDEGKIVAMMFGCCLKIIKCIIKNVIRLKLLLLDFVECGELLDVQSF